MKKVRIPAIKVFHARCLPMCLACLVAGILFVSVDIWWVSCLLLVVAAIPIVILTIRSKKRRGVGVACLVCLLLSLTALLRCELIQSSLLGSRENCTVTGRIVAAEVNEYGEISQLTLSDIIIDDVTYKGKVEVNLNKQTSAPKGFVYADAFSSDYVVGVPLEIGQTVCVTGNVYTLSPTYYDSYSMHKTVRGVYYRISAQTCVLQDAPIRRTAAQSVRCALFRLLRRNMSGRTAGFAYAFLTGDSSYVADEVLTGYRASGTAHLLAVSGLHVGILATLLLFIFKKCKMPAWSQTVALASVLGVYAWLCSATPSVLRASIVATTVSLSKAVGAYRDKPSILSLAGLLLLAVNPLWLFDVSFLLSYAAFAGVVLLYAPIRKLLHKVPAKVGDALSLNLAVTLSTMPLSIYFFGGFSALAVPVNFLLIPVMSVIYPVLFALIFLAAIPTFGILLTFPDLVLSAVNTAVIAIGKIGYAQCALSVWQLPLYYGVITLCSPYCLLRPPLLRYSLTAATGVGLLTWIIVAQFV